MKKIDAEVLFDNNCDCYTIVAINDYTITEQPAMTRATFIELAESHVSNVNSCWVDCNKKLPDLIKDKDYSENVLAWCNNQLLIMCLFWVNGVDEHDSGYIWCQSYYIDGEGQSDDEYAPTHWMPLPKEPSVC